jgi:hypothetical protein
MFNQPIFPTAFSISPKSHHCLATPFASAGQFHTLFSSFATSPNHLFFFEITLLLLPTFLRITPTTTEISLFFTHTSRLSLEAGSHSPFVYLQNINGFIPASHLRLPAPSLKERPQTRGKLLPISNV